ncbi:hypothetical protein AMR74_15550 [Halorubrum tropicale]|uniref:Uncharacterized protein n=1 Tax=Halorubrum tropicale TaxID=1765655 RepID=A0A0N0BQK3_9EURY|nr:hypothetical protein AMR74_15550 [Halorubrum tropicale]
MMGQSVVVVDVLTFPLNPCLNLSVPATSGCVLVGSPVALAFLNESLLDKCVKIRIQSAVVDFLLIVFLEFLFDCESVRGIKASNYVQQISLKPSEVIHTSTIFSIF